MASEAVSSETPEPPGLRALPLSTRPLSSLFHTVFSDAYGDDAEQRRNVCAFGFEANPRHCSHLHALEHAYLSHGVRLKVYGPMAVANVDGTVMVLKLAEGVHDTHNDWGATTAQGAFREGAGVNRTMELYNSDHLPRVEVPVPSVDMSAWFLRNVIGRTLPARAPGAKDAAVVVKSDIEFADPPVLARMLLTGVLCQVAVLYSEHMSPEFKVAAPYLFQQANCSSRIIDLDDESGDDNLKMPFAST